MRSLLLIILMLLMLLNSIWFLCGAFLVLFFSRSTDAFTAANKTLVSPVYDTLCGYSFEVGSSYVIFGHVRGSMLGMLLISHTKFYLFTGALSEIKTSITLEWELCNKNCLYLASLTVLYMCLTKKIHLNSSIYFSNY